VDVQEEDQEKLFPAQRVFTPKDTPQQRSNEKENRKITATAMGFQQRRYYKKEKRKFQAGTAKLERKKRRERRFSMVGRGQCKKETGKSDGGIYRMLY